MSPSRWPRSPSPDRCSRRFCGSSRSYGRSHRPRQHEAFDCHAFKRNRQEECVQMPVKMARSAPRASFGLPELLVASTPRASLATRPERREYSRQFGSHPGNPGLMGGSAMRRYIVIAVMCLFVVPALGQTLPKRDITPGVALTKVPVESVKCLSDLMGETLSADDPVTLTMICTVGYAKCIR